MIECLEIRGVKHPFLKAIARVKFLNLGIIVSDVKLFQKNESYWASLPTKEYTKDGEKKYFSLIQFIDKSSEKKILEDLKNCLLKEYESGKQMDAYNKEDASSSFDGLHNPF